MQTKKHRLCEISSQSSDQCPPIYNKMLSPIAEAFGEDFTKTCCPRSEEAFINYIIASEGWVLPGVLKAKKKKRKKKCPHY